jgi:type IV pilus assembly protein PilA
MFKWFNRLKNKKGFTLIELIVVLAVLGIIALIAIPKFLGVQEAARQDADAATVESIEKAGELWSAMNNTYGTVTVSTLQSDGLLETTLTWQDSANTINNVTVTSDGTIGSN